MRSTIIAKHWGVWPLTRSSHVTLSTYLLGLGIELFVAMILFAVWVALPRPLPPLAPGESAILVFLLEGVVDNTGWILLAFSLYIVLDAALMFPRFAQAARASRAGPDSSP